ncbi:hypothetical protein HNQ59_003600 [Chitinivorax tropicus]|uniref:Uncharacterized protein n=1 Tax=Chitinivorax tropicus TaxID=714531 RepID=A0A840MU11_9PROT|nr:hypothetical protein [Chitinivorax tropicus]
MKGLNNGSPRFCNIPAPHLHAALQNNPGDFTSLLTNPYIMRTNYANTNHHTNQNLKK